MPKISKTTQLPDGFDEQSAQWHLDKFVEFTYYKLELGEPSPHLAIVGELSKSSPLKDRLWLLGLYAATYCLPTAQVLWKLWPWSKVQKDAKSLRLWLEEHWQGIVTRQERRCVRTPTKMYQCLTSYKSWIDSEYAALHEQVCKDPSLAFTPAYYDTVWGSAEKIKFFGRYINIRLIEGLKRYCGIPARLYDIRSIGGWSPKKALCYLYPEHASVLLVDNREGNTLTDELAIRLMKTVQRLIPKTCSVTNRKIPVVDEYILAAMLCEYKGAYEKRHQYPGWTIDQEPLLYDKVLDYWGQIIDLDPLWKARASLFPHAALGEKAGWNGTRWDVAKTLRDYGYNWSDLRYDYPATLLASDFSNPVGKDGQGA